MKQQVFIMHGGDTHETYADYIESLKEEEIDFPPSDEKRWRKTFGDLLGPDYQVILPQMPCSLNSKYLEWKIWFDKFIPHLNDGVIFIGHSLGGIFFAKYFAENTFPKKVKAIFLLAAPYNGPDNSHELADFVLPSSLAKITDQCSDVFIYQSKDDPIVDYSNLAEYEKALPKATPVVFEDKGHFILREFPELADHVKKISRI